jgi:glycosyl transferase family 87
MTRPEETAGHLRIRTVLPFVAAGLGLVFLFLAWYVFRDSEGFAYDFAAYDAAARRLLAGDPIYLPGTVDAYRAGDYEGLYLYPPPVALAFVPFALAPADDAANLWFAFRLVLLAFGCAILPVSRTARLATFAIAAVTFPVLFDLNIGNISVVIFALTAMAWALGDGPFAAVAHALLALLRLPFAVFGVLWAFQRRWRMIAQTAVAGIVIVLVSAIFVGPGAYVEYVEILTGLPDVSTGEHNFSLKSVALEAGADVGVANALLILGVVLGLVLIWYAATRRDADTAFVVTAVATLLTAPFLHPHYLVLLLLPAALLFDRLSPAAIAIPLIGWLPGPAMPVAVIVVLLVLLLPAVDRSRPLYEIPVRAVPSG